MPEEILIEDVPGYFKVTPFVILFLFGKHKGADIVDVPIDYLRWCLREITDAPDTFRAVLIQEIDRRKHEGVGTLDFEANTS